MTEKAAELLAMVYVPMMWVLVVLFAVLAGLGLLVPAKLRALLGVFTRNRPVRIAGALYMLVGAEMFIRAASTAIPMLVKTLGVVVFVDGGVMLLIPTFNVILSEWLMAHSDRWLRVAGLVCLGVAYLFFLATKLPLVTEVPV